MSDLRIAGAGLAGLLAAHAWPQAVLYETAPAPRPSHKALLRFRSDAVARLVGVEFQPVTVRKGIWSDGGYVSPSVLIANRYSQKILGSIEADRSIWNLEPVQRFIAPETFYEQLVESVGGRVRWGKECNYNLGKNYPVISTAPLPTVLKLLGYPEDGIRFHRAAIHTARYRVPYCSVYQTVYFPDLGTPVYRASITGSLLIVESANGAVPDAHHLDDVLRAFGIDNATLIDAIEQKYGKIAPLQADVRKSLLHRLTTRHGVFSLGRFATWRNILLDDVVEDIAVIRRLLRSSEYEQRLHFT